MRTLFHGLLAGLSTLCLSLAVQADAPRYNIPIECTKGPSDQRHKVLVSVPATVTEGTAFKVRVDGVNSGKISHTGLNYIFDMGYEWAVPKGAELVEGSLKIVPGTGTENVRKGARISHKAGVIHVLLPARVESGGNYTQPSFEFELKATAAAGATISQVFRRYKVTANAFIVGDVKTTCDPRPKPYFLAGTKVQPASK
ncbi:MAG TPA: hypothetical protein VK524_03190 [Polyangiaceae bacterium]|nr:hypothetical protein [Polyangiaceae bacterium]